ncbi:hypothetical protein [Butyrivibrio sp. Su6]|uniref:hypothetical protein n=1 Tax=Butyrivibrio sp. Su6 TaxID=1520810 RepID=UPI000CDE577E|nr:hypothetical protein [Butyrivibrio sp. Su6]
MNELKKYCTLDELVDCICEITETDPPRTSHEIKVPDDEEALIITEGVIIHVEELHLCVRTADFCRYDPDEDYYMPDFSISMIYDDKDTEPDHYLYWEQDSPIITLYNYLHEKNISMSYLEGLNCMVTLET